MGTYLGASTIRDCDSGCPGTAARLWHRPAHRADQRRPAGRGIKKERLRPSGMPQRIIAGRASIDLHGKDVSSYRSKPKIGNKRQRSALGLRSESRGLVMTSPEAVYGGIGIGASSIRALKIKSSSEFDLRMDSYLWQEVSFLRIDRARSTLPLATALVWRMKIVCKGHEFHIELISSEPPRGNLLFVNPRLLALPKRLYISSNT